VKGGRLRALGITGAKRSPALPDAPTIAESGLAGYEVYEWNAVFAPAGTPAPVVAKLSEAIAKALQSQEVRDRVAALGGEIAALGPAETARFIREQTELWGRVVRAANIRPE
jgi:tripartite-type tricarboxylate transporter receptor subunit TctC